MTVTEGGRQMKVSVLITTYNLEQYVAQTLDSVLMQQVDFEYEILVGDDGSKDRTRDVVRQYMERYPDLISLFVMDREPDQQYNRIARASRNRLNLISRAQGEYLIFLDGDDVYTDSRKLQRQADVLDAPENRDCVACAHNIWLYWDEQRKEPVNPYTKEFKVKGRTYWRDVMYFHSDTVMFRNVFTDSLMEDIPSDFFDDNIIVFALLKYGGIYYLPELMANYRQVENSSWNSVDDTEKHLINLMDWDVELGMDPRLKQPSVMRHMGDIFYIWRHRRNIPPHLREKYKVQMEANRLYRGERWMDFTEQSLGWRIGNTLWLGMELVLFACNKLRRILTAGKYRA